MYHVIMMPTFYLTHLSHPSIHPSIYPSPVRDQRDGRPRVRDPPRRGLRGRDDFAGGGEGGRGPGGGGAGEETRRETDCVWSFVVCILGFFGGALKRVRSIYFISSPTHIPLQTNTHTNSTLSPASILTASNPPPTPPSPSRSTAKTSPCTAGRTSSFPRRNGCGP